MGTLLIKLRISKISTRPVAKELDNYRIRILLLFGSGDTLYDPLAAVELQTIGSPLQERLLLGVRASVYKINISRWLGGSITQRKLAVME